MLLVVEKNSFKDGDFTQGNEAQRAAPPPRRCCSVFFVLRRETYERKEKREK
jgi:hypothetical protein